MSKSGHSLRDALLVKPGAKVRLEDVDPDATHGFEKASAAAEISADLGRLHDLQERLWAEGRHKVLIVLQGIDTAGKGGTIEHVMGAFNPQGCTSTGSRCPRRRRPRTTTCGASTPGCRGAGDIAIFDRSHYEQVLVVRVLGLEPEPSWRRHYDEINAFESLLVETGTTILKFFLYIDRDEQRERLQARLDDPDKRWKFGWATSRRAPAGTTTSPPTRPPSPAARPMLAPWFVIPSNHKWFRNLAVARIVADTLEDLQPRFPAPAEDIPADLRIE